MLTIIESNILTFVVFLFGILSLCTFMLVIGFFLGGKTYTKYKNIPFESGIDSAGTARLRFSSKFVLVAIFFVIFDVESLYLYIWSIIVFEAGWIGFIEASIFIFVLLISLIYLVRIRALDWTPRRSKNFRYVNVIKH